MAWNNLMYTKNRSPCVPDCEDRHAECKFDGTCEKYAIWEKKKNEIKQEKYKKEGEFISYLKTKKGRRWKNLVIQDQQNMITV